MLWNLPTLIIGQNFWASYLRLFAWSLHNVAYSCGFDIDSMHIPFHTLLAMVTSNGILCLFYPDDANQTIGEISGIDPCQRSDVKPRCTISSGASYDDAHSCNPSMTFSAVYRVWSKSYSLGILSKTKINSGLKRPQTKRKREIRKKKTYSCLTGTNMNRKLFSCR